MHFSGSFNQKLFVLSLINVEILLGNSLCIGTQQVKHLLIINLKVTYLDFELSGLTWQGVMTNSEGIQIFDSVKQILHCEDEDAWILIVIVHISLVFDEPNGAMFILNSTFSCLSAADFAVN